MKGDSGIKLQYSHCRLCNLEELCGTTLVTKCHPNLLKESEVDNLIILISQFDEIILKSYEELEPCILTIYLFHLWLVWHIVLYIYIQILSILILRNFVYIYNFFLVNQSI